MVQIIPFFDERENVWFKKRSRARVRIVLCLRCKIVGFIVQIKKISSTCYEKRAYIDLKFIRFLSFNPLWDNRQKPLRDFTASATSVESTG